MLSKYTDVNKYGGYTWQIKFDSLFHIYIHGTKEDNFVVDLKEWKFISYKTHFSFISNDDLEATIIEVFGRTYEFLIGYKNYSLSIGEMNIKLNQVLLELEECREKGLL